MHSVDKILKLLVNKKKPVAFTW